MYYIYHIQGVKIGCTSDIKARMKQQSFNKYEILEEHSDVYLASDREIELQKKYGYVVDNLPYWKSRESRLNNCSKESKSKGGKIGGKIAGPINGKKLVESGKWAEISKLGITKALEQGFYKIGNKRMKELYSIAVLVYEKDTNKFIGEYKSYKDVERDLNVPTGNICNVLKGRQKSAGGYTFKYKNK
jgi:hypothetical protein